MKRTLLLWCFPLAALAADPADLPPPAQVVQALRSHPQVRAAVAGVRVEEANRAQLMAGPHEFAIKLGSQRRNERPTDMRYREHEIGIERTLRLPGKAAQDAALGEAGVDQARNTLGAALHESARLLLKHWFDWLRAAAGGREWAAQEELLRRQQEVVAKRVGAGDATKLEAMLAEAQLAQAQAQLAQARAQREQAAAAFVRQFPGINLPADVPFRIPTPLADSPADWQARILAHNHELALATNATRLGQLNLRRLDAERMPDPTLGLRLASDRGGQEHVIGLQLTLPLPGERRAAAARAGAAEADVVASREAQVRARVETEAQLTVSQAYSTHAQWQRLADVAARMEENVRLLEKAWRLGEGQFGELQVARRQAIEARLAATQAQLDANEARYRLLLDAHMLWDLGGAVPPAPTFGVSG